MKKISLTSSLIAGIFLLFSTAPVQAQFLKKLKDQVKETVKQTVEQRSMEKASNATNSAIDKTSDAAGKGVKKVIRKNDGDDGGAIFDTGTGTVATMTDNNFPSGEGMQASSLNGNYASYDFIPGDRIIFQPDLSDEADGELPARFVIKKGNAEIQSYEGEKILHLDKGGYVTVAPLMDNDSYLPEQFTLEFDMMYENPRTDYFDQVNDFTVQFFAAEDENYDGYGLGNFIIHSNESTILGKHGTSQNKVNEAVAKALQTSNVWHHVALYFRKNIAKAYIGATRVSATNNFPADAAKFAIRTDGRYGYKIKNMRLAAGGDDKYNKIVTDGKFITHGVLFDVNQSTIKPESMGTLNEIARLMKDHNDLKFEINGHTDNDGNDDNNMKLSQARAEAVKAQLVRMGIDDSRLTTKGFGETKPIDNNTTAEGKANNRRVEFVKM